jgi:membrane fusion protein (multidrug efflux system)
MFARVRLITRNEQDALVLPEQAIVPQGEEQFVFRVVDRKAVRTKVGVGQRRDGQVEIVSGLAAGDLVVSAGQLKLRDGIPVDVAEGAAPAKAAAETPERAKPEAARAPGKAATATPAQKS